MIVLDLNIQFTSVVLRKVHVDYSLMVLETVLEGPALFHLMYPCVLMLGQSIEFFIETLHEILPRPSQSFLHKMSIGFTFSADLLPLPLTP